MAAARVLVVDDSVVVRRLVSDALGQVDGIDVVGVAPNGRLALARIEQLAPDLVVLDVEMPEMDGLEALAAIRSRWPRLPVVMFSTLTERGGRTTLEALRRGATDYVTKPADVGSVTLARERIRDELAPRVLALTGRGVPRPASRPAPPPVVARGPVRDPGLVVVGASTGGPNALVELFTTLPPLPVPVAVVQHMPPVFTALLAERLDAASDHRVREAVDGMPLVAGEVLVAPGGQHLVVAGSARQPMARLSDAPPEHSCRPSVDVLFRSAAGTMDGAVLAIVLTGMGEDGTRGARDVRTRGGAVVVQDEASSVVWGMPGAVTRAGLADATLPLVGMASAIVDRVPAGAPAAMPVPR